jgi:hypothetical protein
VTLQLRRVRERRARRRALTAADVGAWLFSCHPREFTDLLPDLRAGGRVEAWCVRPSYRLGLLAPGQPAVLWVTGARGADPEPGIWMTGATTGRIDRGGERPRAGLDLALLDAPLPREVLRADPRTARMEVLRAAQMSNPSVLTGGEHAAVVDLLRSHPGRPSRSSRPSRIRSSP